MIQWVKNLEYIKNIFNMILYIIFPGGVVVKNPPANEGDTGLIPGTGRFHMLQSN